MRSLVFALLALPSLSIASASEDSPAPRAVQCVSVFEIMDRAAPNWMKQPAVQEAYQAWAAKGSEIAAQSDVDFGTQINLEMIRLADISAQSPDTLSQLAINCLAEAAV